MKIKIGLVVTAVIIIVMVAYMIILQESNNESEGINDITPVRVSNIELKSIEDVLVYEGRVMPLSVESISFKSTARLEAFAGDVGETLEAGMIVASLDISDLSLAEEAARNQLAAAQADYNRAAKGASDQDLSLASINVEKTNSLAQYLTTRYEDSLLLLGEGIISQSEVDGLKLELDMANQDSDMAKKTFEKVQTGAEKEVIEAARAQVAMAETNLQVQTSLLEDASYTLKEAKVIVDQLYEPGELVPAGYPVALVRSIDQSVTIGVTRKDLSNIELGQRAHIELEGQEIDGSIVRVAEIPDQSHFLYEVEIGLPEGHYIVGEIARCRLVVGERDVVMIPITAIMNDGIDYVYVAKEGVVLIAQVVIEDVVDGYAIVTGLEAGSQMITSNLNRISENSPIHVEE